MLMYCFHTLKKPYHSQIVDVLCIVWVKGTTVYVCTSVFVFVRGCMRLFVKCTVCAVCAYVFVCVHLLEVLAAAEAGVNKITHCIF